MESKRVRRRAAPEPVLTQAERVQLRMEEMAAAAAEDKEWFEEAAKALKPWFQGKKLLQHAIADALRETYERGRDGNIRA